MTTDTPKTARTPRKPRAQSKEATPDPNAATPPQPKTRAPRSSTKTQPAHQAPSSVPVPNSRPVVIDPDAKPGEQRAGEEQFKLTVNIPQSLYERSSGLVWHADFTGEPAEIESMTALVRIALVEALARYEKKYNAGMAFPPPARLRRGRAPKLR
jgi:hypothetical protein